MEIEPVILMATILIMGIILMGFFGYIYDKMHKIYEHHINDKNLLPLIFYYPPKFTYLSFKYKNYKYLIIGIIYHIFFWGAISLAFVMWQHA